MNTMGGYGGLNLNINTPLNTPTLLQPRMNAPIFNNEQEAMNYQIGPDSSVLGLDAQKQLVWIIRTDSNGNKVVCEAHYLGDKYVPEPEPNIHDLEKRIGGFEETLTNLVKRFDTFEELIK